MVKRCEERMLRIKTLRAKETSQNLLPGLLRALAKTVVDGEDERTSSSRVKKAWDAFRSHIELVLPTFSCEQSVAGNKSTNEWTVPVKVRKAWDAFRKTH